MDCFFVFLRRGGPYSRERGRPEPALRDSKLISDRIVGAESDGTRSGPSCKGPKVNIQVSRIVDLCDSSHARRRKTKKQSIVAKFQIPTVTIYSVEVTDLIQRGDGCRDIVSVEGTGGDFHIAEIERRPVRADFEKPILVIVAKDALSHTGRGIHLKSGLHCSRRARCKDDRRDRPRYREARTQSATSEARLSCRGL